MSNDDKIPEQLMNATLLTAASLAPAEQVTRTSRQRRTEKRHKRREKKQRRAMAKKSRKGNRKP